MRKHEIFGRSSLNNAAGSSDEQYFTYDAMNRQIGVNLTQSAYNQMVFNQQNNLNLSQGVTTLLDADAHLVTYDGVQSFRASGSGLPFPLKLPTEHHSPPNVAQVMSRPLRIEFPGAIYHVTSRGDRREVAL